MRAQDKVYFQDHDRKKKLLIRMCFPFLLVLNCCISLNAFDCRITEPVRDPLSLFGTDSNIVYTKKNLILTCVEGHLHFFCIQID